jgi:hypothetical protein
MELAEMTQVLLLFGLGTFVGGFSLGALITLKVKAVKADKYRGLFKGF